MRTFLLASAALAAVNAANAQTSPIYNPASLNFFSKDVKTCGAVTTGDTTATLQGCIDTAYAQGKVLLISPGTYSTTGLSYYPGSVIECAPGATILLTGHFGFRALPSVGAVRVTGSVRGPIINNCTIDMNSQGWAGVLAEGSWYGSYNVIVNNVPNTTFSYDDGSGSGAGTYPTSGVMIKGVNGVAGAYYNVINAPVMNTQAAKGGDGIWLGTTAGTSSQKANFNTIANGVLNPALGFAIAIDNEVGNDNRIVRTEASHADICLQLGGSGVTVQRNKADLYCESAATEGVNFTADSTFNTVNFASTAGTTTASLDNGTNDVTTFFNTVTHMSGTYAWDNTSTTKNTDWQYQGAQFAQIIGDGSGNTTLNSTADFTLTAGGGKTLKIPSNGVTLGTTTDHGSGTAAAQNGFFVGTSPVVGQVMAFGGSATPGAGTTIFVPCMGYATVLATAESSAQQPIAAAGTFASLYALVGTAPGAGQSIAFTLRINGATPTSGPTCTISNTNTSCSDLVNTAAITAGQTCDMQAVNSAGSVAAKPAFGIRFTNP